jgi:hypothetical protein
VRPRPGTPIADADGPKITAPLAVDLWHCVARGEAVFLRMNEVRPLRLTWSNGLLATTERLLTAGGSQTNLPEGTHVEIDLDHVTAVMDAGLCRLTNDDSAPHQLTVAFRCNDSILMTGPVSPLVEQRGINPIEQLRGQLVYSGRGNFYQQTDVFWRIELVDETEEVVELDFADWNKQWEDEKLPKLFVKWRELPSIDLPMHRHTPVDYALTDHPSNPAVRSAADHSDAGFNAEQLPLSSPKNGPKTPELRPATRISPEA